MSNLSQEEINRRVANSQAQSYARRASIKKTYINPILVFPVMLALLIFIVIVFNI